MQVNFNAFSVVKLPFVRSAIRALAIRASAIRALAIRASAIRGTAIRASAIRATNHCIYCLEFYWFSVPF
jgi:hypothetical protein